MTVRGKPMRPGFSPDPARRDVKKHNERIAAEKQKAKVEADTWFEGVRARKKTPPG